MTKLFEGCRYFMETYGCQMNVRDSEHVAGILEEMGFQAATDREDADCILFNTCCVRDHAERRVFGNVGALREWKEEKPGRLLGVFGCMMQQISVAEKLYKRFPYVDIVFGTAQLSRLHEFFAEAASGNRVLAIEDTEARIEENLPSIRSSQISAFVNINFGCNNYCSYCIVPYVRGPERSRSPEAIETEVRALIAEGFSEITLLGQNVNSYGQDLGDTDFPALLKRIAATDGLRRLRFMTSHPKDVSAELIKAMADLPNVCNHVHLPIQSGSDRVLAAMNRGYTREQYLGIVDALRAAMTDVEISTDIIVGFPSETEADFSDTLEIVRRVGFTNAFTFKYSPRIGTKAAAMPGQIAEPEKSERLKRLNALQDCLVTENNQHYFGYEGDVLVEGANTRSNPMAYGKFMNFKMVYFPGDASLIGKYVMVRVIGTRKSALLGERMGVELC